MAETEVSRHPTPSQPERRSFIPTQPESLAPEPESRQRRFSRLRLRHASDPELSTRFRNQDESTTVPPPVPDAANAAPCKPVVQEMICISARKLTTCAAPVVSYTSPKREKLEESPGNFRPWGRQTSFRAKSQASHQNLQSTAAPTKPRKSIGDLMIREFSPRPSFSETDRTTSSRAIRSRSSLISPIPRFSTSSTSDEPLYAATTTTHSNTSAPTTTFFKIPRKKRSKQEPLFPLPDHLLPAAVQRSMLSPSPNTPQSIESISPPKSLEQPSRPSSLDHISSHPQQPRPPIQTLSTSDIPTLRIPAANTQFAAPSPGFTTTGLARRDSAASAPIPPSTRTSIGKHLRKRSGTFDGPFAYPNDFGIPSVPPLPSGRTSVVSTNVGRNSIGGGLRSLTSRLRQTSDAHSPGAVSPGGLSSPQNGSWGASKETLVLPEREDGETAGKYYSRLESTTRKRGLALALSKSSDSFNNDVLRSLMRSFKLYEVPLDYAIRLFLWEIDLPGEAQQIDRVVSAFAERYYECNPHIFHNFGKYDQPVLRVKD